ncbi:MAG: hypothetical protein U0R71_12845 [Solirubrobacterales bacterium]
MEIAVLLGGAGLGAWRLRRWLVPELGGVAACLATAVLALALVIWCAEALGSFGLWDPVPYLLLVAAVGIGSWWALRGPRGARPGASTAAGAEDGEGAAATVVALLVAAVALIHFAAGVKAKLGTGMTGFDSTWYHGPFAAGFFQEGDTWRLHFIAPQFLAWFYPANGEILPAAGMLAFGRDLLSPLLNLGWFLGCLAACWALGRPYRVAAWSLALGALALSVPALHDQAGEARNDIVAIFFLLAAVAVAVNAWKGSGRQQPRGGGEGAGGLATGVLAVVGLAAGLAAGTKLNFLLPAAVLVGGLAVAAPRGARWRSLAIATLAALAGGGYWYLRNLAHSGNPLPWVRHLGPLDLPAPGQALGGREAHSVLSYLSDGAVWSDWFLPGLHHGLWLIWPVLGLLALAGLLLPLLPGRGAFRSPGDHREPRDARPGSRGSLRSPPVHKEPRTGGREPVLAVAGLVGLAGALAWLVAPTSASGPEGIPRGFESGLRYLAPALVLGLALLPTAPQLRGRLAALANPSRFVAHRATDLEGRPTKGARKTHRRWGRVVVAALGVALVAVAVGYPVQRHYLRNRYANPSFSTPGLDAAFKWARGLSGQRIATTSTRQYPLFGTDLSNRVQYVGVERPHGGFEAPRTCRQWRRLLDEGEYDYVVASRDRLEAGKPAYPETARWTESPRAEVVLRKPPTVVFKLDGPLPPSGCPSG